jgi:general secretion pathway protein A
MYLAHYGLTLKPFSISPDPRFLWLGQRHKEALATLKYGIQENKGFLLLTGEVGTGKTLLIKHLIQLITLEVTVATIPDPDLGLIDFYNILADEFNMGRQVRGKGEFLILFKKFLTEASGDHRSVLLIIDEAQRLKNELLEEIRVLSNIEFHSRKLISIFLVGQNELRKKLLDEKNRAFRQRISVNYHIKPLSGQETASYIEHRLKVAGAAKKFFTADAMREVYDFSQGFPRLINIICDHAMVSGYSAGFTMIDGGIIKECANELTIFGDVTPPPLKQSAGVEYRAPVRQIETVKSAEAPELPDKNPFFNSALIFAIFIVFFGLPLLFFRIPFLEIFSGLNGEKDEIALTNGVVKIEQGLPAEILNSRENTKDVLVNTPLSEKLQNKKKIESTTLSQDRADKGINGIKTDMISQNEVSKDYFKEKESSEKIFLIYYKQDSTELDSRHFKVLTEIMGHLARNSNSEIIIEGYTDSYGNYFYNKKLSQLRANIVKSYFVGQGVANSRITVIGTGPENPIADNATREGRSKNRRVEIRIIR